MASTSITFSIGEYDEPNQELYTRILKHTKQHGINRSWLIVQALQLYERKVLLKKESYEV